MLSSSGEHAFRSQSRAVTQRFIPGTAPGCLSQIPPFRCSDGPLGTRKSRVQLLKGQHANTSPSLDRLFGGDAGAMSVFPSHAPARITASYMKRGHASTLMNILPKLFFSRGIRNMRKMSLAKHDVQGRGLHNLF